MASTVLVLETPGGELRELAGAFHEALSEGGKVDLIEGARRLSARIARDPPHLVVLEYERPQLDESDPHALELAERAGGLLLDSGTISLQSESHPIEFRRVELRRLD